MEWRRQTSDGGRFPQTEWEEVFRCDFNRGANPCDGAGLGPHEVVKNEVKPSAAMISIRGANTEVVSGTCGCAALSSSVAGDPEVVSIGGLVPTSDTEHDGTLGGTADWNSSDVSSADTTNGVHISLAVGRKKCEPVLVETEDRFILSDGGGNDINDGGDVDVQGNLVDICVKDVIDGRVSPMSFREQMEHSRHPGDVQRIRVRIPQRASSDDLPHTADDGKQDRLRSHDQDRQANLSEPKRAPCPEDEVCTAMGRKEVSAQMRTLEPQNNALIGEFGEDNSGEIGESFSSDDDYNWIEPSGEPDSSDDEGDKLRALDSFSGGKLSISAKTAIVRILARECGATTESEIQAMLSGINVCEIDDNGDGEILVAGDEQWQDVEFEVALDSGSVVHVCANEDAPGYNLDESLGSKRGQNFLMGDGGKVPNQGQKALNLSGSVADLKSVFQIAKVTRPLMSVGKICDEGFDVSFNKTHASILDRTGKEICKFERQPGGLYVAKLKLKAPSFGRP